ncbi:calcium-binding protein [Actibacterium sp. D379-3]
MSYFAYQGTLFDSVLETPTVVGRLDAGATGGPGTLVLTDNGSGQRVTFALDDGQLAVVAEDTAYPPTLTQTSSAVLGGRIVTLGKDDLAAVAAQSESDSQTIYANRSGEQSDRIEALALNQGGQTYLYLADTNASGLSAYAVQPNGDLVLIEAIPDDADSLAAGITALATAELGGTSYVIAASAAEDGLTSYRVDPDGSLTQVDAIGAGDLLPINDPQALEMVEMDGTQFIVVAASGSSSLTVLRLEEDGTMVPVDQVMDDLNTRFANASVMESFTVDGRVFVLAAGSDDGLSLFTMLPDGRLLHLETLVDTAQTSLANITDMSVQIVDGEVQLFVVSGAEAGLSQFTITPGPLGDLVQGGGTTLNGTARNDLLGGGAADNVILGGAGDDILIDGAGSDVMAGGPGADIFVLSLDGEVDTITDFRLGEDQLDLSAFGMLYDVSDIQITATSDGAELTFGVETVVLISADGLPLDPADFKTSDVINVPRLFLGPEVTGPTGSDEALLVGGQTADHLLGGASDQTLMGRGGDDILTGGAGADVMDGGEGVDLADYSDAAQGVRASLADPSVNSGDAAGDSYDGIEGLSGSDHDDRLIGDAGDNVLRGGDGRDRLEGGGGNDQISGGADNDELLGHDGDDSIYGDGGNDNISASDGDDFVDGGDGHDQIGGGNGRDTLFGGAGNDEIGSGNDDDYLDGGDGNDRMSGGYGADVVIGGAGHDTLAGSYGNDIVQGGDGNDSLGGGTGKDELYGGNGDDSIGAGSFDDLAWGGTGNDFIGGGDGNDRLWGEDGDDTLNGGLGNDALYGGAGADIFVFNDFTAGEIDTIQDFELGEDRIRLGGVPGKFGALQISDVWINDAPYAQIEYDGQIIRLAGVQADDLSTGDFIFV